MGVRSRAGDIVLKLSKRGEGLGGALGRTRRAVAW